MKALSIKQPWAWLICAGYKDIENRDWYLHMPPFFDYPPYAKNVPKRIYVHAGKQMDLEAGEYIAERLSRLQSLELVNAFRDGLPLGALIGEVDITGCVTESKSPWFVGKYGFTLANPVLYDKPIPYRGQLGFFEVELSGH
jgi:hypothetical protein